MYQKQGLLLMILQILALKKIITKIPFLLPLLLPGYYKVRFYYIEACRNAYLQNIVYNFGLG